MNRTFSLIGSSACRSLPSHSSRSLLSRPASSSTNPTPSSSSRTPLFLGIGALVLGGGYYFLQSPATPGHIPTPAEAKKAQDAAVAALGLSSGSDAPAALTMKEWRDFKLIKVEPYNHNTSRFVFELPPGHESGLSVASAILTKSSAKEGDKAALDDKGKPVIRPYTPVTPPDQKNQLDLLIKKYEKGAMSQHIHSLKPGDSLALKGPLPKFPYKPNEFEQIVLIGGGSGITPLWQILQRIDSDSSDKTKALLLFSNVSEKDILLREELEALQKKKPEQFKIQFVLDKPEKGWKGPKGYVTEELLKDHLPLPAKADKIKIFVCGPPGQVEAISGNKVSPQDQGDLKGALADLGYSKNQVYKF